MIKVLCTRVIPNELIQRAASKNIIIDTKDFISVRPDIKEKDIPAIQDLINKKNVPVIFTSKHAVQILGDFISKKNTGKELTQWDIYTISNVTLKSVHEYFPESTIRGDASDAGGLAEEIVKNKNLKEMNFFCGNIRRDTIPTTLKKHGIKVYEFVIYETKLMPRPIPEKYGGYIFFSPSAVESFFLKNKIETTAICFAIGKTTASAIKSKTANNIITSKEQDAANMITNVISFYQ